MGFISDWKQKQRNSTIPTARFRDVQRSNSETIKKDIGSFTTMRSTPLMQTIKKMMTKFSVLW